MHSSVQSAADDLMKWRRTNEQPLLYLQVAHKQCYILLLELAQATCSNASGHDAQRQYGCVECFGSDMYRARSNVSKDQNAIASSSWRQCLFRNPS
jgi:hypothetical protein